MQNTSPPVKWTIPFAQGDSGKVEVPATTADPTRASLTLGFPPLTMQPPEAGGVPPQGEDFNGAMNQVARITWWKMAGGAFPYDAAFATDSSVNGYPQGAVLSSLDLRGAWVCTADNNTVDPDATGTNWVPVYAYGTLALTGQTGGTLTLTPAQAMKKTITVAGALTSNLTLVVPAWLYAWQVTNLTTGAFTVTVKTASGAGVAIPQNSAPTGVTGDGTNITQPAGNVAAGAGPQAMQFQQAVGRLLGVQTFSTAGTSTYTPTAGTTKVIVEVQGSGGAGGGTPSTSASQGAWAGGGGAGSFARALLTSAFAGVTVTVGAGGVAVLGGDGGNGNTSSFGSLAIAPGGSGSAAGVAGTVLNLSGRGGGAGTPTGGNLLALVGTGGDFGFAVAISAGGVMGGAGGSNYFGPGAPSTITTGVAATGPVPGAGGGGAVAGPSTAAKIGGNGAPGIVIVYEYA